MNDIYAAKRVVVFYQDRIRALFTANAVESLSIQSCHQNSDGRFCLWAGFWEARLTLWRARANNLPQPPVLILGWHSPEQLQALGAKWIDIVDWKGAAYIQYSHDNKALKSIVVSILEGSREPIARELLPQPWDISSSARAVIHWLEGRMSIAKTSINQYMQNNMVVQSSNLAQSLQTTEAIPANHQCMLDALYDMLLCQSLSLNGAECDDRLAPEGFLISIQAFRAHWEVLQNAKRKLYETEGDVGSVGAEAIKVCEQPNAIVEYCKQAEIALAELGKKEHG